MDHVQLIIQLFARKEKRDRLLTLAASARRFADFRHDLLHDRRSLKPDALVAVAPDATVQAIVRLLGQSPAAHAFCISEISEIDQREMPLHAALALAVGREMDTLIFPLASKLAYYENHEGERWLLKA